MKKKLLTFVLIIASSVALAQNKPSEYYQGISISYLSNSMVSSGNSQELGSGLGVNYLYGFNLVDDMPLYLETGANLSLGSKYTSANTLTGTPDISMTFLDIQVPVNVSYSLNIQNAFSINPFVGLNAKSYILGIGKKGDDTTNLLSNDESATPYNIFNLGWQVGANVLYSKYWIGISYGSDFTKCAKNSKAHWARLALSLGIRF